jgi:hypothetical protein
VWRRACLPTPASLDLAKNHQLHFRRNQIEVCTTDIFAEHLTLTFSLDNDKASGGYRANCSLLERSPVDAPSHLFEVTKVPYLIDLHPDTLL